MSIINIELWNRCVEINKDPYGKACVDVAREVMRILDEEKEFDASKIINIADENIKAGGITGFMAGCVATMVSDLHSRGEEFRKQWNKDIGSITGQENSDGVLNPALITLTLLTH
jgi:hypothetical protein